MENETNDHFLTCNHNTYRIAGKEDVEAWYEHSKEINLEPILSYYILQVLMDWKSFVRQTDIDFCDNKYKKLCREQHRIGWHQLFYGRITNTWVDIQNDYTQDGDSTGIQIITSTIRF